jgi:GTP-binding protein EngB required for normal cell division
MKASMEGACTALCFFYLGRLVASQYAPVQYRDATIMIVGYSGHGKSSALNAMAYDPEVKKKKKGFHVCTGKGECTKDVTRKKFSRFVIGNDGKEYQVNLTLVDTPGFPDLSGNVDTNNAVIDAARQYLNAVVWVVKPMPTSDYHITQQDRVLLNELNQLRVPIFQLVNGRIHYEDAAQRKKRLRIDKAEMLDLGDQMAKTAGLSIKGRFISTTKPDLKDETQAIIYRSLSYAPLTSDLRDAEDLGGKKPRGNHGDEL